MKTIKMNKHNLKPGLYLNKDKSSAIFVGEDTSFADKISVKELDRKLAKRSYDSATQIYGLISNLQKLGLLKKDSKEFKTLNRLANKAANFYFQTKVNEWLKDSLVKTNADKYKMADSSSMWLLDLLVNLNILGIAKKGSKDRELIRNLQNQSMKLAFSIQNKACDSKEI